MNTDVLIIGGGPAGLTAAIELGERNLDVTIVDESYELGGQLWQQAQVLEYLPSQYQNIRGFELAEGLIKQVNQQPSIHSLLKHRVIGLYEDGRVGISDNEEVYPIKAKKIIVATGAYEKAIPFIKWTLPGIITVGAAQTLINREFVLPGKEAVIIGMSNFSLDIAWQLLEVGIDVKGIIVPKNAVHSVYNQDKLNKIEASGISIYKDVVVLEAKGNGKVEEIVIQHNGKTLEFKVDLVCLDGGRSPILDVFYQLDCSFGYRETLGGWLPQYNANFNTNKEGVFAAGNALGISNHGISLLTGRIAGISVCEELNVIEQEEAKFIKNTIWKEIEILESKENPNAWEERKLHINHFSEPMIKDQFIS